MAGEPLPLGGAPWPVHDVLGVFDYDFATLSTGSHTSSGRVVSFSVVPLDGADAKFNIDGGDTITVRSSTPQSWAPRTKLNDPTFNHVEGRFDLTVEKAT